MATDTSKPAGYDPAKTRNLLQAAAAYGMHPLGEIIGGLAEQLAGTQTAISEAQQATVAANSARDRALADLETAQHTIASMRAGNTGMQTAIDALKAITINPRGASKVAKDALAKIDGGKS
jgi:hypothetical protein